MLNVGQEIKAVLLILGIATGISFVVYKIFREDGLMFCLFVYVMAVLLMVREAPIASYLTIAATTSAIAIGASKDRRPLHLAGLVVPSMLLAGAIFGAIYFVSGLFGGSGGGACTRMSPQFC